MDKAILFGLLAALLYGVTDFVAKFTNRANGVLPTMLWGQSALAAGLTAAVLISGQVRGVSAALWGITLVSCLAVVAGTGCLYYGLAKGRLTVVSPLMASYGAVSALLSLATGEKNDSGHHDRSWAGDCRRSCRRPRQKHHHRATFSQAYAPSGFISYDCIQLRLFAGTALRRRGIGRAAESPAIARQQDAQIPHRFAQGFRRAFPHDPAGVRQTTRLISTLRRREKRQQAQFIMRHMDMARSRQGDRPAPFRQSQQNPLERLGAGFDMRPEGMAELTVDHAAFRRAGHRRPHHPDDEMLGIAQIANIIRCGFRCGHANLYSELYCE
jgi:uncharacterized membrane protein